MENQLSDKKYKAYADVVSVFFNILKDTKSDKQVPNKSIMIKMIDSKKDIFMYGSDTVFHAFNSFLTKSSRGSSNQKEVIKSGKTKCAALIKRNAIFSSKTRCNKIKTRTA